MGRSWWRGLTECGPLEKEMNGKPLQYSCLENPMNSMKRQKDRTQKDTELKWTGTGEFNSADHYIYYCGQESIKEME